MAEWQNKSGVQGTKEADFFLQCLASVFADCLAKDRREERDDDCDNLYSNSRLRELDSSSPGIGQALPEVVWRANTVPGFTGSTQGMERQ